jgi:hypothetical protein
MFAAGLSSCGTEWQFSVHLHRSENVKYHTRSISENRDKFVQSNKRMQNITTWILTVSGAGKEH